MGLDTTHNAFHGPYSQFMQWRKWLAAQMGIPLMLMEYYYSEGSSYDPFVLLNYKFPIGNELEMSGIRELRKLLPIKWDTLKPNPLHVLLCHSDCDGYINWKDCGKIADALGDILSKIDNDNKDSMSPKTVRGVYDGMYNCTKRFMEGCELAFNKKEKLEFH